MGIEKYLILNKYLLFLFGVSNTKDLLDELKDKKEGVDSDGRSYFVNTLRGLENLKLSEADLLRYDDNIQDYLRKINYNRESVSLKYFQYLAVLFTEIFLDNLKNKKEYFLEELNDFLKKSNNKIIEDFSENDLNKLAFWMATGAGKTLIAHINYYQFFKYNLFSPDNIIFITPNEGLSKQHFDELRKSGIPCKLYRNGSSQPTGENEVLVIEITKLEEEKKSGGVTISVEEFEGRNLILVDEAHKGKKTEEQKWARIRNKLAKNGFVFEYSATFGQILSENNKETLKEYAKSILFNYSYKYFYLNGYGKDFTVFNVKQTNIDQSFQEVMFVANLLSFYEQVLVYEENFKLAKEYNLEKPLWIFVGTTVTGKKDQKSDVVEIVKFIEKVIKNEKKWLNEKIKMILDGEVLFKDENEEDVFKNKFEYLRKKYLREEGLAIEDLIEDIYKRIFGGKGEFYVYKLKNSEGEFGLKVGENKYFGVINIGTDSEFREKLENKEKIKVHQDAISGSLFDSIRQENSSINILIGSKKFMEGWDTWRVSSMGLLHVGKEQGPQIIQLFGRGVRLKGKGMSLKRSNDKSSIRILEKLNIFGIKSDYLSNFLKAISKEEVEFETIKIPVEPRHEEKWCNLYILAKDENKKFEEDRVLKLEYDDKIDSTIDLSPRVSAYLAKEKEVKMFKIEQIKAEVQEININDNIIDLFDWNRIWKEVCDFKILRGYWNLVFSIEILKKLLRSGRYKILASPKILEVKTYDDIVKLEDIAILILKRYVDLYYRKNAKLFETEFMCYSDMAKEKSTLFVFEECGDKYCYTLQIDKRKKEIIDKIKELASDLNNLKKEDANTLPRIYFDNHLYVPLLIQDKKIDKISPAGLVESEKKFVKGLRDYLKTNKTKFSKFEIYLLRNYPKTGVGFFKLSGFYPDFIMWIKEDYKQCIVFIDPKGLEHTKELDDEKIKLKDDLKILKERLKRENIILDSFILSITPYDKLIEGRTSPPSKDDYINNHVLFLEDKDWAEKLFEKILIHIENKK